MPTDNLIRLVESWFQPSGERKKMKKYASLFSVDVTVVMLVLTNSARAAIDEAKALVDKAEAYFQANGK